MDHLHALKVFVAIAEVASFAGAARKLGLSPPAVTRAVNDLESHLGLRLLTRTTRVVRLTEAGERYARDGRAILAAVDEAERSAAGLHGEPRGRVTLTAPVLFGTQVVMPVVTDYLARYPQTSMACLFMDRVVNLFEEGVDVAVRIGELPDSSLQAVQVGQLRRVVCAAPAYLAAHGTPQVPAELPDHAIVVSSAATAPLEWRFGIADGVQAVKLQPRLTVTANDAARAAALAGFGITRLLSYQVADALRAGALTALLADFEPEPLPVHVVHHEGRHASQRVRAFLDLAIAALREHPALQR
jgi:DNA-binding transcriptional LysR family regulator